DSTTGSGRIVITSPLAVASNAAGFTVTCTQANISLSVSSSPASPDNVTCGSAAPTFTLSGVIESSQSLNATYHWVLPSGATASTRTARTAGHGRPVTTPSNRGSDPFSGIATRQVTSPPNVSQPIPINVTCSFPPLQITTTSIGPCNYAGNNPGCPSTLFTAT